MANLIQVYNNDVSVTVEPPANVQVSINRAPTGAQGLSGAQGAQGIQGVSGAASSQGLQGIQGTSGSQGLQGLQGLQGSTPIIGGNTTEVQYNDSGNLAGDINFTYDQPNATVSIENILVNNSVKSDLIPNSNITFDLGNTNNRWRDLYLGGNTIYLGNAEISANANALIFTSPNGSTLAIEGNTGNGLILTDNITVNNEIQGNTANFSGNIVADYYYGNGYYLQGLNLLQGIQGLQGITGSNGIQGTTGIQGATGLQGTDGMQGTQGIQGTSGLNGSQGIQGIQGTSGLNGSQGTQGIQGTSGLNGSQGIQGIQGVSGQNGSQGLQGIQGLQGVQGFGYAQLQGTQGIQGVQGTIGLTGAGGTQGHWGAFYDTTTQYANSSTTAYVIDINSTDPDSFGVSIVSGNQITFSQQGTYSVTYSIQFVNQDNSIQTVDVWLRKNGTNVADTNSRFDVPGQHGGVDGHLIGTVNYVLELNANDYLQLVWRSPNNQVQIQTIPVGASPTRPQTPGIIVTATQVTYTLQGLQGLQGITGSQGLQGIQGLGGSQGIQGIQGIQGVTGVGTPGGSNTEVQYNNNGNFDGSNTFIFNNTTNTISISQSLQVSNNTGNITVGYNTGANTRLQLFGGENIGNIQTAYTPYQNNAAIILYNAEANNLGVGNNRIIYATSDGGNVDNPQLANSGRLIHEDAYLAWNGNNYVIAANQRITTNSTNAKWQTNVSNITPGDITWNIGALNANANVESLAGASHSMLLGAAGWFRLTFNEPFGSNPGIYLNTYSPNANIDPIFVFSRRRGNTSGAQPVQANDSIGSIDFTPENGGTGLLSSKITAIAKSNATASNTVPADLQVLTVGNIYLGTWSNTYTQSNNNVVIGINNGNTGNIIANVYYGNKAFLSNLTVGSTSNVVYYNNTTGELSYNTISSIQGLQGIQGIQGEQGLAGSNGTQGTQGIQGIQGVQSLQGITGSQGLQGLQGPAGSGTTPGSNTQVVYNDNGNLAGSAAFTFDNTSNTLTIINTSSNSATSTKFTEGVYNFGNANGNISSNLNINNGSIQRMTAIGNITIDSIANVANGTSMTLIIAQDATGNRQLTSAMKFAGNLRTLSTAANAIDVMCVFYDGTNYLASLTKGYA